MDQSMLSAGKNLLRVVNTRIADRCGEGSGTAARDGDAGAAVENSNQGAGASADQLLYTTDADQRAAMRPPEAVFADALFERLQRLTQKVVALTDPQPRVVSGGFNPINLAQVQHCRATRGRDYDSFIARNLS